MDIITRAIKSKTRLQQVNACRLFLQVTLLSKICSANGKVINYNILKGKQNSIKSNTLWPRQKSLDQASWKTWRSILKKKFWSYENNLQSQYQLGSWTCLTSQLAKKYKFIYSPALNEIYQRQGKTIINWFAQENRRTTISPIVASIAIKNKTDIPNTITYFSATFFESRRQSG